MCGVREAAGRSNESLRRGPEIVYICYSTVAAPTNLVTAANASVLLNSMIASLGQTEKFATKIYEATLSMDLTRRHNYNLNNLKPP